MKAVVIFTVHRRYFELERALTRLSELSSEFQEKPDVVVVWACPEIGRLWFFQKLLREGRVQHLVTRPNLPGESGGATSYPESHNIRLGLEYVAKHYQDVYAIVQAADVYPHQKRCYSFIDQKMQEGSGSVVFFWQNGCIQTDIWHTNCFAVKLDPIYWPPLCELECQDVLERLFGIKLSNEKPAGVEKSHNYNSKRFTHDHLSESQPAWAVIPQQGSESVGMFITGHKPWYARLWDWACGV